MSFEPSPRMRTPLARLPIRLRLATAVAGVAFATLSVVAVAVGVLTAHRLRADFQENVSTQAENVAGTFHQDYFSGRWQGYVTALGAVARVYTDDGQLENQYPAPPARIPNLGPLSRASNDLNGYGVATVSVPHSPFLLQYGVPDAQLVNEVGKLELFLAVGVIGGTLRMRPSASWTRRFLIQPSAGMLPCVDGRSRPQEERSSRSR